MNVRITSIKFDTSQHLKDFINDKVEKLRQFYEQITGIEVILKLDNNQSVENKLAEIRIQIPNKELFAKKESKTFEESVDAACEALRKQLTKNKEKRRDSKRI